MITTEDEVTLCNETNNLSFADGCGKMSEIDDTINSNLELPQIRDILIIETDENIDSGVEDEGSAIENNSKDVSNARDTSPQQELKTKHKEKKHSLSRKRPSLFGIFRSNSRFHKQNINENNTQNSHKNVVIESEKKPVSKIKTPGEHEKSSISRTSSYSAVAFDKNDAYQTSDLGDSAPSTPVSTISSLGLIEVPGLVGMHNLGNTCYFNAIMQCLSHIDIFSEYFAMDYFLEDLTNANSVPKSRKMRTVGVNNNDAGQLTYMIGMVIKSLWNADLYSFNLLHEVMDVVSIHNKQYNVFEQQDALEFFMWLIEKIHEESIKTPKKKVRDSKKKKAQCKEEQAVLAFASFTRYTQSYIQGLFLSQYLSTIPCLNCHKNSYKFDPYTSLSLDIPPKPRMVVFVTVSFACAARKPTKYGFHLQRKATIHELRTEITDQAGIKHFVLVEICSDGMKNVLFDDNPLSILTKLEDCIYAVECGTDLLHKGEADEREDEIALIVSNVERCGNENKRFGLPLVVKVPIHSSFIQLQVAIRRKMETNVRENLRKLIREKQVRLGLRVIRKTSKVKNDLFLPNELDEPLIEVDIASEFLFNDALQMKCLYLVAEWEPLVPGWYMSAFRYTVSIADTTCVEMRMKVNQPFVVDLEDCLRLQTQEEKLPANDVWKCPFCRKEQNGITKKLTLWSLPDVLVLHLKRFDQVQQFNGKVNTLVRFPIRDLNISPYVASSTNEINERFRKESVKLQYQPPPLTEEECMYDLRGVCNHLGSYLNRGHYTSYCYNSVSRSWYLYDDRYVRSLSEDQVVTNGAYLLFYERRKLSSRVPKALSVSRYNTRALNQHWAFKMKSQHEPVSMETASVESSPSATSKQRDTNLNSEGNSHCAPSS